MYPRYLQATGAMVYQPSFYKIFTGKCNIKPCFYKTMVFGPLYFNGVYYRKKCNSYTIGVINSMAKCAIWVIMRVTGSA